VVVLCAPAMGIVDTILVKPLEEEEEEEEKEG
jgi:hypothetical protein